MFIKPYFHDPILRCSAKFNYKRKLPLDMTGSALFIPANCTEDPTERAPLACSLFLRFQEEHPRSSVLFPPVLYVVTLSAKFLLLFLWISQLRQTVWDLPHNHVCCLNEWEASNSNTPTCSRHFFHSSLSAAGMLVSLECRWRRKESKPHQYLTEASRFVQSSVEITSLLCYCFTD